MPSEVKTPTNDWENLYLAAGSPGNILLVGFKSEKLKPLTGKTLAEIATMRKSDPIETLMTLIAEDESRIDTVYFLMAEENVRKALGRPWIPRSALMRLRRRRKALSLNRIPIRGLMVTSPGCSENMRATRSFCR